MKTTVDDTRLIGTLLGGDHCIFLEDQGHKARITPRTLLLIPGVVVPVGTQFTKIGSNETSAGNSPVHTSEGITLEYQGQIQALDGTLAIFYQRPGPDPDQYLPCYWYMTDPRGGYFIYFNRQNSSRILKLTHCEYKTP